MNEESGITGVIPGSMVVRNDVDSSGLHVHWKRMAANVKKLKDYPSITVQKMLKAYSYHGVNVPDDVAEFAKKNCFGHCLPMSQQ